MLCDDISEFESYMASQPVRSLRHDLRILGNPRQLGQPDPENRNALALEGCDRVVDSFTVELAPFLRPEIVGRSRRGRLLRLRLPFVCRTGLRLSAVLPLLALSLQARRPRTWTLADRHAIGQPDDHHDEVGLLRRQLVTSSSVRACYHRITRQVRWGGRSLWAG